MAEKINNLSDGTPRDATKMASNNRMPLYMGIVIGLIVVGGVLYWLGVV